MAGEQTAGNHEEALFPESGCSPAGKEAAASGRDGDLRCLPGREQREHHHPTASVLKLVHQDVVSWDCSFFLYAS